MTPSDDILDLLGRYATGSLTDEERQRLFDAALSDQDLFEELAREQELKMLLDEPGARDRMIRALDAPNRRAAWILSGAVAAALSVVAIAFLMRPVHKPQQVAIAKIPPPPAIARTESVPQPVAAPAPARVKAKAIVRTPEPPAAQPDKNAVKKEAEQIQVSAVTEGIREQQQQSSPGGPKQNASNSRRAPSAGLLDRKTPAFGFHYSLETKGHLIIVPGADGYLFVKSRDGTILFGRKQIAAAITTDIVLPDTVDSVTITFSQNSSFIETAPAVRDGSSGNVEGTGGLAIEIKVK